MMIANVSHEIRTPLHAIINFTELALQDSSSHNVPGQVVEYIQHALNAGQRLMSTITDLLDLTRLDYGRETVNEAPFKLTSVLDNAIRMLAVEAEKKGLQTIVEFSDAFDDEERVGVVLGDEGKLWQATTNLVRSLSCTIYAITHTHGKNSWQMQSSTLTKGSSKSNAHSTT